MSANLQISRNTGFFGVARKMKVYVNEVQVGTVLQGKTLNVSLEDGPSVVYAKMDWWVTPSFQLSAQSGGTYQLVIGTDLWKAFRNPVAWLPFCSFEGFTLQPDASIPPPISPYPR